MFKTLGKHEEELIVKKSRFIALSCNVSSQQSAKEFVEQVKKQHITARHIAYAYRVEENSQIFQKSSDDGEPSGTAGKPILNLILNEDLMNVCICVVRYFGGIKLGAGGLTRAYGNCAGLLKKYFVGLKKSLKIVSEINNADRLLKYLENQNYQFQKKFDEKLYVEIMVEDVEELKKQLNFVEFVEN